MTIWERVATALTTLGVPFADGKFTVGSGQDFPSTYLVFYLISSVPEQHADNAEVLRSYPIRVNVFCKTGLTSLPDVDGAMQAAGFIKGAMTEIPPEEEGGHYGLGTDYVYTESED